MRIVAAWCAVFAIYLLLAGRMSWHEVATGIALASLATGWASVIRQASQRHFRLSSELLEPLGRGLAQLLPAAVATGGVLMRLVILGGVAGCTRNHVFLYDARDGLVGQPVERARRAFAVLLASCAPDRFVMNVDRHSDTVLIHAIVHHKLEPDPTWLT